LHLIGAAIIDTKDDERSIKRPAKGTPLAALWDKVESDYERALAHWQETPAAAGLDPAGFVPKLQRLAASTLDQSAFAVPMPADGPATVPQVLDDQQDREESESGLSLRADMGTLAHRTLQLVAEDGLAQWSAERIAGLQARFRRWLESRGHEAAQLDQAVRQICAGLGNAISTEQGRWILQPREIAGNELALTSCRDGQIVSHIIDRTFVDNGERWIIDYKSARHDGNALEEFLAARAESYRPQLERYAALFSTEALPIRKAIYFLAQGRLVELH
jgi:hypothetical protein